MQVNDSTRIIIVAEALLILSIRNRYVEFMHDIEIWKWKLMCDTLD